jgi:hypothetical protein
MRVQSFFWRCHQCSFIDWNILHKYRKWNQNSEKYSQKIYISKGYTSVWIACSVQADRKKRYRRRAKSRAYSSFSVTSRELVPKQFVLAGQRVNSAYYCEILRQLSENVRRLCHEIWLQKLAVASQKRTKSHFFSHKGIFHQNQHDCRPNLSYFSLFPRLKMKLKGRHFDTIEVIETESQRMLNTLTEHKFQDAFK